MTAIWRGCSTCTPGRREPGGGNRMGLPRNCIPSVSAIVLSFNRKAETLGGEASHPRPSIRRRKTVPEEHKPLRGRTRRNRSASTHPSAWLLLGRLHPCRADLLFTRRFAQYASSGPYSTPPHSTPPGRIAQRAACQGWQRRIYATRWPPPVITLYRKPFFHIHDTGRRNSPVLDRLGRRTAGVSRTGGAIRFLLMVFCPNHPSCSTRSKS